ncbi:MAG: RHS repeat-associated core domain-containing protein [Treponema sp.]|nr:RHS repeat-associated core domain-containing protein [Treponema sp.]MBQ2234404.1 RHS repeat-associated core domain-containing protein [Treponema sp.]MBQ5632617.1 RHS repeat-associated core domain-containing protein [Treponema sp.]MBQ5878370.1 RHS repeat-associated core domain-containing protein [Treponema sp.]
MWQMSTTPMGMRQTKHIFVGETRIATKNNWWQDTGTEYEKYNTYWYHADHLGSAQLVSNWKGEEYERIEYTPYGEIWVEKVKNGHESINYRFTGKEMDSETGLYYFGARYLDPKYSRWLSTDPALRDYIPQAPVNDEARKANNNLPGQGGLFNQVNFHLYHYAGNNPVRYIDPDGRAHFGKRPMKILNNYWGICASNPIDDFTNTELSHEHLFFDDGTNDNLGFSWDGLFKESTDQYQNYYMDEKQYDDELMRQAVANVEEGNYSAIGSRVGNFINKIAKLFGKNLSEKIIGEGKKNNCQDWASNVRKEYNKLLKELPKTEQNRIKEECKKREVFQYEQK